MTVRMRTVFLAWIFFLLAGLMVSLVLPLGEGFDEPWHLGYIQYVAQTGTLPTGPELHLSVELETFLTLHPIGWRLHAVFPALHTQEEYWQRPELERSHDDDTIRSLRFSMPYQQGHADFSQHYETHQAPLYYLLTAPLFRLSARFLSLTDTFLIIRLWSVLLASSVVPVSYIFALRVSHSVTLANAVAVLVAMFPGLYPDVARISNDALAVPLAAAIFVGMVNYLDSRSTWNAMVLGILLLAGLLTKAFFIPVLLAVAIALFCVRDIRAVAIVAVSSVVGWVWYFRNIWVTGSMTGLPETVSAKTTIGSSIASLGQIRWMDTLRLAAVSHIWMGNWSLLQYRGWLYQAILIFYAIGIGGFLAYLRRSSSRPVLVMLLIYVLFAASLIYYATQVFQQSGVAVIQGWYLSPMVPIETLAFVLGISFLFSPRVSSRSIAAVSMWFLAMLVYGNLFIAAPYYSGLIAHSPSGSLRAYVPRLGDVAIMGERLTRYHWWIPSAGPVIVSIIVVLTGFVIVWSMWNERPN
jgi:hypothetical protein